MSKVAEKKYPGVPVEIINFGYKIGGSKLQFDKKAFEKILSHESVIDRKISIISIVGAFRKGKSFFLGYCLRFLYTIVSLKFLFIK